MYNHSEIEKAAREKWAGLDLYRADLSDALREKYYLLVEFPYPSGDLHIGHWYAFAVTDIYARLLRLQGKNVLFPIGFDAFGLPAENAAIKNNVDPKEWTYTNIARMREQLETMGASFDWSKEVVTCEPDYYHWTQWLFTKLFEHGLASRREAAVKWCPKDATVLANEQVIDGHCERCGTAVEEKRLTQWFLKITEYADRLLAGLDKLPWREEIKDAQRAWIGKSEGARIRFEVIGSRLQSNSSETITSNLEPTTYIEVFTTRPDTIFGATYLVLAPEHPLLKNDGLTKSLINTEEVQVYVEATKQKTERERSENKEKTGVKLEGVSAVNPATKEDIPIYVADYVLGSYGTAAVMAVPAHDERDFEFATKFNLPKVCVVQPFTYDEFEGKGRGSKSLVDFSKAPLEYRNAVLNGDVCQTRAGTLTNSGEFSGRDSEEATGDIVAAVGGERATNYRLRDWLVSRQRYWGCPIPIVYDPEGKPHLVPAEHLPWLLPTDVDFKPTGKAPLASSKELQERVERLFGVGWTPEYDTLDTFVDSSWYFLRYFAPKNAEKFSDTTFMQKWMPIDRYSGGSEHTTMHLLYARFFTKALYDLGLVPVDEPFTERYNRGLIMGTDGGKMSKSKGNTLNPDEFVQKYGSDAVRIYMAFIGPYNEPRSYPWALEGVASMRRFLERIARLSDRVTDTETTAEALTRALAAAARKVSEDSVRFKFNTAVAALMILVNEFEAAAVVPRTAYGQLLIMLAPFAPHLAEHLWAKTAQSGSPDASGEAFRESIHQQSWPQFATEVEEKVEVIVQVSGRKRGSLELPREAGEAEARAEALKIPAVRTALGGKEPTRVVYVPGRIINLVV